MSDDQQVPQHDEDPQAYEAPEVSDLDTTEGPAVTAAGKTLIG
jgi:hypothetical protein